MKWEPPVAMVVLIGLGAWMVYHGRGVAEMPDVRPGAVLHEAEIVGVKGYIEVVPSVEGGDRVGPAAETATYRWLPRDGSPTAVLDEDGFVAAFGGAVHRAIEGGGPPGVFRLLNISSWGSLLWVSLGFLAQAVFASRFIVQWIASERRREAYVPEIFWWISLFGGASLFAYFVWRRDIVGVCGQASGVVIYLRNLRLIYKKRRRDARELTMKSAIAAPAGGGPAEATAASMPMEGADPAPGSAGDSEQSR